MKAVGARLPRYDGVAHVTGRTKYVADQSVQGMLACKGLRSPHHSARIVSIDTSRAEAHPGVFAVATYKDVPKNTVGHLEALGVPPDEPYLAEHEVRFKGQLVGGVAAIDEATATEALDLIDVKYEVREPFLDIRKAFDPGQPQMTDNGNVFFYDPYDHRKVTKGDVDAAFEKADVIVKGSYRPSAIEQAPIEPQGCLVVPESDGRLTVYTCTQAMYFTMGVLAEHLQRSPGSIKLVGGTVGGGFGGKVDSATEPLASILALKARRPVRWIFTREEEMLCGSVRASWHVEMADALTKDGWILGRKVLTLHDAGAYTRFSSYGATKHSFHLAGAYTIPALRTQAYVVWTNHVPTTAMRGFGVTSASFAVELQMTRNAAVLGIDPGSSGSRTPTAPAISCRRASRSRTLDDRHDPGLRRGRRSSAVGRLPRHEERAARGRMAAPAPDRPGVGREARRSPGGGAMKHRGRGLAAIEYPTGMNQGGDPSQAWVKIKPDGRVDVFAGTVDLGQGSKTVHTQIVADTLGVPSSRSTWTSPTPIRRRSAPARSPRAALIGGLAVLKAAKKAKEKMLEVAGQAMETTPPTSTWRTA